MAENVSAEERIGYQSVKVFYTNSAIDIATESDAIKQLMDMMVMVRLQRIVWNNGGVVMASQNPHTQNGWPCS